MGLGSGHGNPLINKQKTFLNASISTIIGQFPPQNHAFKPLPAVYPHRRVDLSCQIPIRYSFSPHLNRASSLIRPYPYRPLPHLQNRVGGHHLKTFFGHGLHELQCFTLREGQ
jgi:hypothetical protein